MKLFWSSYWQNPKITAAVHCFHYNSHHHYNYHHFHYHWKLHLYFLKTLLTIHFIVILSSICFTLPSSFFTPSKRTQGHILDALCIPFIYIYNYLDFLTLHEKCQNTEFFWSMFEHFPPVLSRLTCLFLFALTYPYLCSLYTLM